MKEFVKSLTDIELDAYKIERCPNCHAGVLDNGKCVNNYTFCSVKINHLKTLLDWEKKARGFTSIVCPVCKILQPYYTRALPMGVCQNCFQEGR